MTSNNNLILLAIGIVVTVVASLPTNNRKYPELKTIQKCGSDLADALNLVCAPYGGFNSYHSSHKTSNNKGPKKLVVDECCNNPCSLHTLRTYCANYTINQQQQSAINKNKSKQNSKQQQNKDEDIDNRLIEMFINLPITTRRPKNYGSKSTSSTQCMQRCTTKCAQRILQERGYDNNWHSNGIQLIGTVAPELKKRPHIFY